VQIIVRVEQFEVVLLQRAREATRILVETERGLRTRKLSALRSSGSRSSTAKSRSVSTSMRVASRPKNQKRILTHLRDSLVQIIVRVEQFEVVLLQRARKKDRAGNKSSSSLRTRKLSALRSSGSRSSTAKSLTHLRDSLVQIIVRVEQFEVVLLQRAREATRILVETERDLAVLLRLPDERKALSFRVRKPRPGR
jgi:hypothetical protein